VSSNSMDDYIKALIGLGLTGPQARTYIALLELGISTVGQLAISSNLDRPDTYRATKALLQLGIIEKVVASPTKFEPLAFEDAVQILMQRRAEEEERKYANLSKLIKSLDGKPREKPVQDDNQLMIISSGEAAELKLLRLFENASESINAIVPRRRFFQWILANDEAVMRAVKRHLTVRVITERLDQANLPSKVQDLVERSNLQIKFVNKPLAVCFRIYDSKELLLTTSPQANSKETLMVWSNNTFILELAQAYFYSLWGNK